jgi:hypothetical protein
MRIHSVFMKSTPWLACRRPERAAAPGAGPCPPGQGLGDTQALLQDSKITVAEIAKRLAVAPSMLYRYVPRPSKT